MNRTLALWREAAVVHPDGSVPVRATRRIAAVVTAFAGTAHYAVIPEHRAEWWLLAVAFTLVGALQLGWGVLAWQVADRAVLAFGAALDALVLVGWAVSRTVGLPVGPHAGAPEPVGVVDLAAGAAELVAVVAIVATIALSAGGRGGQGVARGPA